MNLNTVILSGYLTSDPAAIGKTDACARSLSRLGNGSPRVVFRAPGPIRIS